MTRLGICTILLGLALAAGAHAQGGGRGGIAYVEAPEISSGVCTGRDAASAFACAKKACISGGGTKQDCLEIAYCFPARWSVDVFAQSEEGNHWHEFYCGWDSKALALAAARTACEKRQRSGLIECSAVLVYDEDGTEYEVPPEN
ncbi:MAG: hypothetical protein ACOH2J_22175 [Allorhizobium sp.]